MFGLVALSAVRSGARVHVGRHWHRCITMAAPRATRRYRVSSGRDRRQVPVIGPGSWSGDILPYADQPERGDGDDVSERELDLL